MKVPNRHGGFTLIELLIVVATVGLIASIAMGTLITTREKGRDTKRIEDLQLIRKALDLYYADRNEYPPSPCGYNCNGYYYSTDSSWQTFESVLEPYIDRLPVDPINNLPGPWTDGRYSYTYGNVGSPNYPPVASLTPTEEPTYDLTAQLESTSHPERCAVNNYRFYFYDAHWCGPYSQQIYEASPH